MFRTIDDLGIAAGTRVLLRVDANVPMDGPTIRSDAKLAAMVPTIADLRRRGAVTVVVSHLGGGKPRETLAPIAVRLSALLGGARVPFVRERIGTTAFRDVLERLRSGDVVLLENIRRYRGEQENSAACAQQLARLADVYVNDAFAVSHRAHASVVAVAKLLPAAAGPLLMRETSALDRLTAHPARPFVALIGGAKMTTKVGVLDRLRAVADTVLVGGALAHPFFVARGYDIGRSLLESEGVTVARRMLKSRKRKNLTLPIDVVVGDPTTKRAAVRVVPIAPKPHAICASHEAILDIGPETIRAYAQEIQSAQTLLWNGPMGVFEVPAFRHGSTMLARKIASRSSGRAYGVVGGGETLAVLAMTKMERYIDHICTGGGAMLAYIAGDAMPGIEALRARAQA